MKTVRISKNRPYKWGSFGRYYYLGRSKGIKVVGASDDFINDKPALMNKDRFELFNSKIWKLTEEEYENYKKASRYKFVPRVYDICPVLLENKWFGGILLQHICGTRLDEYEWSSDEKLSTLFEEIVERKEVEFTEKLNKIGVENWDIKSRNMIRQRGTGKIFLIDFTPTSLLFSSIYF